MDFTRPVGDVASAEIDRPARILSARILRQHTHDKLARPHCPRVYGGGWVRNGRRKWRAVIHEEFTGALDFIARRSHPSPSRHLRSCIRRPFEREPLSDAGCCRPVYICARMRFVYARTTHQPCTRVNDPAWKDLKDWEVWRKRSGSRIHAPCDCVETSVCGFALLNYEE